MFSRFTYRNVIICLLSRESNYTNLELILNGHAEAVCISLHTNAFRKGMNPSVGQLGFLALI